MPTVVDTLTTRYTMDAQGYVRGADQVTRSTSRLGATMSGAVSAVAGLSKGLAVGLVASLAASLTALPTLAINASVSWDTMKRSLDAVTGSAERTKQVLGFIERLALPSVFNTAELGEAAKIIEAFGLKTERFLPIAEKLGTIFGGTAGDMMQFVNALGMIKAGRAGEGLEALGRAGISRDALKLRGMEFSKSGEFKGQISNLLNAIEDEVNAKFGKLAEKMASGPGAKIASFMDQFGKSARQAGDSLLVAFVPAMEGLAGVLEELNRNKVFEKWANAFKFISSVIAGTMLPAFKVLEFLAEKLGLWNTAGASNKHLYGAENRARGSEPIEVITPESPIATESVRTLKAIEANTAPIREMMSYIFGGGELGRAGVSVASMRSGGGSTSKQLRQLRSIGVIT